MTYSPDYFDFTHTFRGQECLVTYAKVDSCDWWVSPLLADGTEGTSFNDLTAEEEETIGALVDKVSYERSRDYGL